MNISLSMTGVGLEGIRKETLTEAERDAELMRRVAAGEPAACALLVDRHLARIVNLAYRILGERAEAEDVAQEALLRLWRQSGRWQARARLSTWLHRVAYNLCVDLLRKRRTTSLEDIAEPVDLAADPAAEAQRNQVARIVDGAMAGLPERQRSVIVMTHFQGLGNPEVAEIMDISVEAVESLLARGRRRLRGQLADLRSELLGEW